MATGRVLQFDHTRGYGFVAAEDGGDDIFLHASVFDGDTDLLYPGMRVEFQVMSGDRGRKAFAAHTVQGDFGEGGAAEQALAAQVAVPIQIRPSEPIQIRPSEPIQVRPSEPIQIRPSEPIQVRPSEPVQVGPSEEASTAPAATASAEDEPADVTDEEQLCDVLSPAELTHALTELLLDAVPGLTGQQILAVRRVILELAQQHGWSDS